MGRNSCPELLPLFVADSVCDRDEERFGFVAGFGFIADGIEDLFVLGCLRWKL